MVSSVLRISSQVEHTKKHNSIDIHVQRCRRNSVVIQGCHKYLNCLKQSRDYYAVIHVKVLSPTDPHGKVSSESWDTQT